MPRKRRFSSQISIVFEAKFRQNHSASKWHWAILHFPVNGEKKKQRLFVILKKRLSRPIVET